MSDACRTYDCIVVGGGAAGLCLGVHLAKLQSQKGPCLILERRSQYVDDRSWCFWENPNEISWIDRIVSKQWWHWEISGCEEEVDHRAVNRPYCYVRSSDFYQSACSLIKQSNDVNLQTGVEVSEISDSGGVCLVRTDHGDYRAKHVIDARPAVSLSPDPSGLLQIFVGSEISFSKPMFDPRRAVLMGNLNADDRAVWFQYVLPLDAHRALIEETAFASEWIEADELDRRLKVSIQNLAGGQTMDILRHEKGVIPMQSTPPQQRGTSRILRAGLAGGAVRASTGYALRRIDKWAKQCAAQLGAGRPPCGAYSGTVVERSLDRIFLRAVRANLSRAPEFFLKMAKGTTGDQFAAFLTGSTDPRVLFPVISRMPKRPFLAAATQNWIGPSHASS
tara:strand:+ start:620 stop:1795 length:1176 start_codon:yes stop_codon:yes gene_type:complete